MRIHSLQHEPFEGLANIAVWAENRGHSISTTQLFKNQSLPKLEDFDWLVIMGGSMNVYEETKYPWLIQEKKLIRDAISKGKIVLGICLGAQLIADVLGGRVSRNRYTEIGWFPVTLTKEARNSRVFSTLPRRFIAFHWHGDTFEIPPNATRMAESEACVAQAFEYGKAIGLQFHLEYSVESINLMLQNCGDDIVEGRYIQKPEEILSNMDNVKQTFKILCSLLDNIAMLHTSNAY